MCAAAASGTPLALPASASLHSPRCACLGLQSSTYDAALKQIGWPTQYEHLVNEHRPVHGVTCPVCGGQHLSIDWGDSDLRCVLRAAMLLLLLGTPWLFRGEQLAVFHCCSLNHSTC